ncbi:hypothetical protein [uncultured Aliiroseovarius sp.]|uniref:hypothetical protein n=1 Tax=uncultured Aliiroseovarius sp. TaxID=1658783 RepID=UPI002597282A|nr:hypothetical protein [uncultured Aliiroseovarius sp.]
MPISIIITGIFTGTLAAAFAISLDSGVFWAMLSYASAGALALLGAGLVTAVRRNVLCRLGGWGSSRRSNWDTRLDRMAHQPRRTATVGVFTAYKRGSGTTV